MITADELKNSLLLIEHHIDEALEALEVGEDDVIEANLLDIKESTEELRSYLPRPYTDELDIGDIADEVEAL